MFHSPSVRSYTFENTNVAQKKLENVLTRKPLLDRSVNSKTPDTGKLQKPKVSPKIEDDLNGENFTYSFKDTEDSYEDIWPQPKLNKENLVRSLRHYCSVKDTPPPSPVRAPLEISPMFFELPNLEMPDFLLDEVSLDETIDVEVPYLDESDLDISI